MRIWSKLIIRLDDACETMNHSNWRKIEDILDNYGVKPIVGIIPRNGDPDFAWPEDKKFWIRCLEWQLKGWTIAQHGYAHRLHEHNPKGNFQLNIENKTELGGLSYEKQLQMIEDGLRILRDHEIYPTCFFAPCHTYDRVSVEVIKKLDFKFISDGYAFRPYLKNAMIFLQAMFDSPYVIGGVQTFVFHPNNMMNADFNKFEEFLFGHKDLIVNADRIIEEYKYNKKLKNHGIIGALMEITIYLMRRIRIVKQERHNNECR